MTQSFGDSQLDLDKKELRKTFKTIFRGYKTLEEIKVRYNSDV